MDVSSLKEDCTTAIPVSCLCQQGILLINSSVHHADEFEIFNFQVLAANVVAVGWNTYLSWASHRTLAVELPI